MAEIKKLQVDGADIYPVTHESAVYDNEGKSIESKYLSSVAYTQGDDIKIADENGNIIDTSEIEAQIQAVDTKVGELSSLRTSDKDNIVDAINELFQSANNGKELIANAIGEPLSAEDTFQAMSNDINGLLSTFKTNMMNNGITVESGDKFKQLIDKIANMVEEGEGKGIKFAEGIHDPTDYIYNTDYDIETNLDFTPTLVFCVISNYVCTDANQYQNYVISNFTQTDTHSGYSICYIKNVTASKFTLHTFNSNKYIQINGRDSNVTLHWYAIGVGEEDTTLRDSLANILQDAGVEVTEEDDMASLISKVDQKFDESGGLDIITATELPSTGKEGQICVVMENPIDNYAIISPGNSIIPDSSVVLRYNTKTPNYTFQFGNQLLSYNFYSTSFNGTVYPSYYWENSSWNLLTQSYVPIVENGVTPVPGNSLTLNTSSNYFIFTEAGDEDCLIVPDSFDYNHLTTTTTPIDFGLYNKVEVDARVLSQGTKTCYIGRSDTARTAQQTTSVVASYCYWHSQGVQISSTTTTTYTFDISEATGTGYLLFYSSNVAVQLAIVNIRLYP